MPRQRTQHGFGESKYIYNYTNKTSRRAMSDSSELSDSSTQLEVAFYEEYGFYFNIGMHTFGELNKTDEYLVHYEGSILKINVTTWGVNG
jgi:hypothetical protein